MQEQLAKSPNYIDYLKIENWNGVLPQAIGSEVNPFVSLDGSSVSVKSGTTSTANSAE